jgi:hypothetical protein
MEETIMDAFLSYSSKDKPLALRLEQDLKESKITVWINHVQLRRGRPLIDSIQDAIKASDNLILLWSDSASKSRFVSHEWQAAYHLEKHVIPCQLDDTDLPPLLLHQLFCDFRASYEEGLEHVLEALRGKASAPQPQALDDTERQPNLQELIDELIQEQPEVIQTLRSAGPIEARALQERLDKTMEHALKVGANNSMVLNLAGYHKKNWYMIMHWVEIQLRESPQDVLLEESEKFFFSSLSIKPDDPSALNGLGSVLMLQRDLDASEFYIRRAIAISRKQNRPYPAAERDLKTVLRLKKELQ